MPFVDVKKQILQCKIVYYGTGLGGKTTNLRVIHQKTDPKMRGKLLSLETETETERTLFFDFVPISVGKIRGLDTRFSFYTVPGQSFYNLTRRAILKDVDGIVADSQLERVLDVNSSLERNVTESNKRTARVEQERDQLEQQLHRLEQQLNELEDARTEVSHLEHERAQLAAMIEDLGRQLADTEQENRKQGKLGDRMRTERDDALEELESVEAQFTRAMEMVTDLRARISTFAEERESLLSRLKVLESQLKLTEEQRDELRAEVDESRLALEEIRRQVADACVLSQRFYAQAGE